MRCVAQDYSWDKSVTEGPTVATAQGPQVRHTPLMFRIVTDEVAVLVEDILLPADPRTRSKHKHKYRHFITNRETFLSVCTVPEWNLLPEACIKADTTETFKVLLRPTSIEHMHIIAYMPIFVCFDCLSYFNQSINQAFSVIGPMALFGLIVFLFFTCTIGNFRSVVLYILRSSKGFWRRSSFVRRRAQGFPSRCWC